MENAALEKPKSAGEVLMSVGYSKTTAETKPGEIIANEGVQAALEKMGFTEHNAKKVVAEIMLDEEEDGNTRLKAADMTLKVHGSYAPERSIQQNVSVEGKPQDFVEAEKLRLEYEEKIRAQLNGI